MRRWSASCAFADLDRDGDLDLFVTNYVDADPKHAARSAATREPGGASTATRSTTIRCRTRSIATTAAARSPTSAPSPVSARFEATASASSSPTTTTTAGRMCSWPTTACRTSCSTTGGMLRFAETGLRRRRRGGDRRPGRAPAWASTPATTTATGASTSSSPTSISRCTRCIAASAQGLFADATHESGIGSPTLPFVGFGVAFLDFDNDAQLDIAIANGHILDNAPQFRAGATYAQRKLLFRNTTRRRFVEVGRRAGPGFALAEGRPRAGGGRHRQRRRPRSARRPTTVRPPICCATTAGTAATRCSCVCAAPA